jgi:hypothetical protein
MLAPVMSTVPMRTVTCVGWTLRMPVTMNINSVGTVSLAPVQPPFTFEPAGRVDFLGKGSPGALTHGFVTLSAAARPPAPFVDVKMSGCDGWRSSVVLMIVPLLWMTTRYGVAEAARPVGTTKLIWFGATE